MIDYEAQVAALVALGYDLADAEASVRWVSQHNQQDDPGWIPTAGQLDDMPEAIADADAAIAWDAPGEFQRILDARSKDS